VILFIIEMKEVSMAYLEKINFPSDLKNLSIAETQKLADEIRQELIDVLSKNGGHVASNLGIVELTLALHRVFELPKDSIVFDVGHQCYVHKLLTGRKDRLSELRKKGGLSGFTSRYESEYDVFGAGHSGTSVSAALGIAAANKMNGSDAYSIAVVGDGSLTNGMIYEALNNCSKDTPNVIIVLNDNEMSISKNVGAMSSYLSEFSNSRSYIRFKNKVYAFCLKTAGFGKLFLSVGRLFKNLFKKVFLNKNYFECLGLKYFGPIDGHDQELLELVFDQAKRKKTPCIVHVVTQKGKGCEFAEKRADLFHSVGPFDKETGKTPEAKFDFSACFGKELTSLAKEDESIVAVTAAMGYGTGLSGFNKEFPDRFFDVGIAEEHALTFCAGLAAMGKKPFFAVYSSFLQRCYDQLIHDVAIQKLPVVVAVDRAGLVPGDGMTHQGIYDSAFLLGIPGFEVYTPENYADLKEALVKCSESRKPCAIRYPKGTEDYYSSGRFGGGGDIVYTDVGEGDGKYAIITYGRMTANVLRAAELLRSEGKNRIIKLKRIKPIDHSLLLSLCDGFETVFVVEEGIKNGGVGESIAAEFSLKNKMVFIHAIDEVEDGRAFAGNIDELFTEFGFTPEKIADIISKKQ